MFADVPNFVLENKSKFKPKFNVIAQISYNGIQLWVYMAFVEISVFWTLPLSHTLALSLSFTVLHCSFTMQSSSSYRSQYQTSGIRYWCSTASSPAPLLFLSHHNSVRVNNKPALPLPLFISSLLTLKMLLML